MVLIDDSLKKFVPIFKIVSFFNFLEKYQRCYRLGFYIDDLGGQKYSKLYDCVHFKSIKASNSFNRSVSKNNYCYSEDMIVKVISETNTVPTSACLLGCKHKDGTICEFYHK